MGISMRLSVAEAPSRLSIWQKLWNLNWPLVFLLCMVTAFGIAMLYSAAQGWNPWASRQLMRFGAGLALMLAIALVDVRVWLRYAYVIYFIGLVLLVVVEVAGSTGMGAQRWITLGGFNFQPSETMKMALVLGLARYFHSVGVEDIGRIRYLIVPLVMILAPAALVLRQPDLGTAIMLIVGGGAVMFIVGVRLWKFGVVIALGLAALPVAWSVMHSYQRQRILTFLDPESDPLGSGYHILQSKIALGSGGITGKGFLLGTQSQLNFLPERHTDFIFTMLAEEFGLVGGLALLSLYFLMLAYAVAVSLRVRNQFGRIIGVGVCFTVFLYVFINVAMVMGLVPVVGVPLPLISYGGTAMLSVMIGFGLLLSASIHREVPVGRHGTSDDL
jgi:rod shape determining protein RodA